VRLGNSESAHNDPDPDQSPLRLRLHNTHRVRKD